MDNGTLERLVTDEDPVPAVWEALWERWADTPGVDDYDTHYDRSVEEASLDVEWLLRQVYPELYTEVLPERCVLEASLSVPEDGAVVVMDGASIREAPLFEAALSSAGYETAATFDYATVPSNTTPFRERVDYAAVRRAHKTAHLTSPEPSLSGTERVVWAPYPDTLVENVQEGRVETGDLAEAGEQSVETLLAVVERLDADRIVVRSDHGYTRLESGLGFPIADGLQDRAKELFGGDRSVSVADATADELLEHGVVAEADGWFLPVGRYTWPVRGKYSTFQHGGLGLTEVLTPRIEVEK